MGDQPAAVAPSLRPMIDFVPASREAS